MPPKLYKAADVCELAQLQSYVLRSWEKEFPRIGVQKSADSPRLYRQSDLDQVLRIKQLVFGEGLTLAGARRRMDEEPVQTSSTDSEVEEVLEALASDARTRIARVRDGLRSILRVLSSAPGTVVVVDDDFQLAPSPASRRQDPAGGGSAKRASSTVSRAATRSKLRTPAKPSRSSKAPAKGKRSRANA